MGINQPFDWMKRAEAPTGIAISDRIGIVLDDKSINWRTVSTIVGTAITLNAALTGAASSANTVFAYTTKIARPLRVIAGQRRASDGNETPLEMISHNEYQEIPVKTSTSIANQAYYQPEIPDGFIYLWPQPETSADAIRMTCVFPIEDFDASTNTPDLPQEWLDCLVWNLSKKLCPSYGTPAEQRNQIIAEADSLYTTMQAWDRASESTTFEPDFEGG